MSRITTTLSVGILAIPMLSWTIGEGIVQRALIDAGQPVPREVVVVHRIGVMATMTVYLMAGISALSMPRPRGPDGSRLTGGSRLWRG